MSYIDTVDKLEEAYADWLAYMGYSYSEETHHAFLQGFKVGYFFYQNEVVKK